MCINIVHNFKDSIITGFGVRVLPRTGVRRAACDASIHHECVGGVFYNIRDTYILGHQVFNYTVDYILVLV